MADHRRDGVKRSSRGDIGVDRLGAVSLHDPKLVEVVSGRLDARVGKGRDLLGDDRGVDPRVAAVDRRGPVDVVAGEQVEIILRPGKIDLALAARRLQIHRLGAAGDDLKAEPFAVVSRDEPRIRGRPRLTDR